MLKRGQDADEIADRFSQIDNDRMHEVFDRMSSRVEEILDESSSQEQFEVLKPGFVAEYSDEVIEMALDTDLSVSNLQLMFDMLHLEMEDKIQEAEMGMSEEPSILVVVKVRAFGGMIRQTRDRTLE